MDAATVVVDLSFPELPNSSLLPLGASSAVAVTMWKSDRAHSEERASPRNPKVVTDSRSAYVFNFDV